MTGVQTCALPICTDNTKYAQYTDADKNTRSATSAFDVDLSSQNKYAVEFDLALTKSSKDDVQFVVASGTMPTANTGMTSNYIFKINMAGNSNNCKINDVDAATVTLTDAAWYHYTILVDKNEGLATVNITDKDRKSTRLNSSHPSSSRMPSSA